MIFFVDREFFFYSTEIKYKLHYSICVCVSRAASLMDEFTSFQNFMLHRSVDIFKTNILFKKCLR
jgi:hypothetical protein